MLAYKTRVNIDNEMIFLKIPGNFKGKRVDVIVLETNEANDLDYKDNLSEIETFYDSFPIEEDDNSSRSICQEPNEFQKFLLTAPTWSDIEYQNFLDNRKLFNQWKIK
jgi:hypothetical protein